MSVTASDALLDDIANRCLGAALVGVQEWARFKTDAERRTGLPWPQIRDLLDERTARRKAGS